MVEQPGSLYLTRIGPDSSLLMLVAKKNFFGHIRLSFLGAHILKEFGIGRSLLDHIKKGHIYLHLIKYLEYFLHLYSLFIVILKPLGMVL